jgi:hypothetical protein
MTTKASNLQPRREFLKLATLYRAATLGTRSGSSQTVALIGIWRNVSELFGVAALLSVERQ